MNKSLEKLIEKKIQLMKAFIDNPSAKRATEAGRSSLCMCWVADHDEEVDCMGCAWEPICQMPQADPSLLTDEEISTMLLDAIKRLAIYEAKHG